MPGCFHGLRKMIAAHLRETAFLPGRAFANKAVSRSPKVLRRPERCGSLQVRNFGFLKDLGFTKPSWLPSFKKVKISRSSCAQCCQELDSASHSVSPPNRVDVESFAGLRTLLDLNPLRNRMQNLFGTLSTVSPFLCPMSGPVSWKWFSQA